VVGILKVIRTKDLEIYPKIRPILKSCVKQIEESGLNYKEYMKFMEMLDLEIKEKMKVI